MTVKRLRGTAARDILNGTSLSEYIEGHAGDDDLYGGAGDDTLSGGAGADRMFGGLGSDTYVVDNVRDQAIEEGSGNDLVEAFVNWTLGANFERLTLRGTAAIDGRGNGFHNTLYGNDAANDLYGLGGSDILSGGLGADRLFGGTGNERYDVFDVRTKVFERAGEGYDRIMSFGISYTMGAHTEELRLMGGDGDFNGTGNNQDNKIYGGRGKNVLRGLGGNDTLDGGGGADRMYGGTGNDVYYVNHSDDINFDSPGALNAVDVVIEAAGEGIDTVYSDGNFVLGANIENLTLTGTLAPWGLGNVLNNIIIGNTSSNILNGGAGADRLIGGRGADTYYVDNVNDVVVEEALQGPDVVRSTISYTLPDNVEQLRLLGSADLEGIGNGLHNVIVGNTGHNILRGGAGNDILDGYVRYHTHPHHHRQAVRCGLEVRHRTACRLRAGGQYVGFRPPEAAGLNCKECRSGSTQPTRRSASVATPRTSSRCGHLEVPLRGRPGPTAIIRLRGASLPLSRNVAWKSLVIDDARMVSLTLFAGLP